jgi:hypothetical protein
VRGRRKYLGRIEAKGREKKGAPKQPEKKVYQVRWSEGWYWGFSQQSCHQGPFDNRRDLEPIDSEEPDPHAAFAKTVLEVYCSRVSYEHSLSDFLFPQTPLVLSVTRSRVSLDCQ